MSLLYCVMFVCVCVNVWTCFSYVVGTVLEKYTALWGPNVGGIGWVMGVIEITGK